MAANSDMPMTTESTRLGGIVELFRQQSGLGKFAAEPSSLPSTLNPIAQEDPFLSQQRARFDRDPGHLDADNRIENDINKKRHSHRQNKKRQGDDSYWLIDSNEFNWFIGIVVVINCVAMGIEADHPMLDTRYPELSFTFVFSMEMIVKVCVMKVAYFHDRWNCIDASLVMLALIDLAMAAITSSDSNLQSLSILRVLRLVRLVRVVRLVKTFEKLVLVVNGVVNAMQTTFWVAGMLLLAIYIGGIFCVMFLGHDKGSNYPGFSADQEVIDNSEMFQNFNPFISFGSLTRAMLTLFNIAILAEWNEVVQPVMLRDPVLVVFFIGYVMFVTFGLMNVMIGMIVDSVMQDAASLVNQEQEKEKKNKRLILQQIGDVVKKVDKDEDRYVDLEELDECMAEHNDSGLRELLGKIELPAGFSSRELMRMLDNDGDGRLQREEFVEALYRLLDSNDFQRVCMMQLGVNEIKSILKVDAQAMQTRWDRMENRLRHLEHCSHHLTTAAVASAAASAASPSGARPPLAEGIVSSSMPSFPLHQRSHMFATSRSASDALMPSFRVMEAIPSDGQAERDAESGSKAPAARVVRGPRPSVGSSQDAFVDLRRRLDAVRVEAEAAVRHELHDILLQRFDAVCIDVEECCAELLGHGAPGVAAGPGEPDAEAKPEILVHHFDESIRRLGMEVTYTGLHPSVARVTESLEAENRGIAPGDAVVAINSKDTSGKSRDEILQWLRARPLSLELRRGSPPLAAEA